MNKQDWIFPVSIPFRVSMEFCGGCRAVSLDASVMPIGQKMGNEMKCAKRGPSRLAMGIILAWAALHGLMTLLPDSSLLAKDKGLEPYALLLGTCFTGEGFSLPGAKILVEMKAAEIKKDKGKKWQTVSNVRGEFA